MADPILDSQYPDSAERQREADAAKLGVPTSMLAPDPHSPPEAWVSRPGTSVATPVNPSISPAKDQIRAFEDTHFGKHAVRINGHVERGFGSAFKDMSPEKQAQYAGLEGLVVAEQAVADASAALESAKTAHEAAKLKLANLIKVGAEKAKADKIEADRLAAQQAQDAKAVHASAV
jgi:hypothetical protein